MIAIGIDPSPINTALVLLNLDARQIEACETLAVLPAAAWLKSMLTDLDANNEAFQVYIEQPPWSPRGMTKESSQTWASFWLYIWLCEAFQHQAKRIGPGAWKPAAKGWKIQYPTGLADKHQRDAYAMLMVQLKGAFLE